jgi:hypothetical protein
MNQKRILTFLLLTTATLLLFNCGGPSPFPPKDARIDLFLENSLGQRSFNSVTDTVEKQVRVGMTAYLQVYITSVVVTIAKNTTEIDTVHTFDASTDWSGTQWIDMRFHSTGTRKVTVVVSIQGEQNKIDTASITILGMPLQIINHPPTLRLLSGNKNVQPGQTCTLVFTADDVDTGTIFNYSVLKGKPAAAALTDSTFTWTPGSGDTGTFPVDFLVADNGKSPMSDTLTESITVSSQSIKTPPIIMVLQDTSVAQGKTLAFFMQTIAPAQDTVTLSATDTTGAKLPDSATFNPKTGLFTWTPTFSQLGLYKIVFTATDGNAVARDTVKITVTKTDRPPTVQAQSLNTGMNLAITVTLAASDPDNDSIIQWQLTQQPHNGTATLADSTKGKIVYTPNSGFSGVDTFAVKAYDGSLWSLASASVIVTVNSIKLAPVILTQPRPDTTVNQGGLVAFTVAINNASPSPAYIWYQGIKGSGTMKDSSTNPSYQKTGVTAADSGNYYVIVVNFSGADTSAYAHLKVNVPPSAPTLSSPANSATGIVVSPTLTWSAVAGAATYRVQVSTASDFSTGIVADDSALTTASKALSSLTNNTLYHWRVNAKNAGGTSAWSTPFSFTTIVSASGVPVLSSPANNATGVTLNPTLTWSAVAGAVTYQVQVSTASDFSTGIVVDDSILTAVTKALSSLTNGTLYFWRVNAKNAGGTSAWSTASSFTTIVAAPGAPVLSAPANNATGVAVSQTLSWVAVTGAATYRVQVSTASDFSTGIVADDSMLTAASKAMNSLTNNTVYYWRVNAKNAGGTSAWSTAFSFTTIVAVSGVPVNTNPANGATGVAVNPTLTWSAVTGAVTYRVQVSTASDFSTGIVVDDSTLTTASKALSALTNSTLYYWHVNAKNAGGTSIWSTASSFTTIVATPGAPVLSTPANNATGVTVSPTVTWTAVTGAVTYRVQVSTASDFSAGIVVDDSTLTAGSKAVGTLSNGTKYYWRVNAKNAGGTGAWASSSFTTIVKFALSITAANGTVTPSPAGSPYDSGTVVSLTASPATGYSFSSWSGGLTGTANPATITMNGAKSVTANFSINTFNITASAGANGTISPNGVTPVNYGATQAYTITPATGYHVADVLVDGSTAGAVTSYSFTNVTSTHTISATFAITTYTLTVSAGTGGTVTPTSPTTVNYGAATAITATPSAGYKFVNWTASPATGVSFGNANSASTTVTLTGGATTVTANFQALTCSWNAVYNFQTASTYPWSVAAKGDTIFVGTHKQGVFRSFNNGSNWTQDPSFATVGMNYLVGLAVLGGKTFVGNNYGNGKLFYSSDYGTTWGSSSVGGNVNGFAYYSTTGRYFAATSDQGVMYSTDNGATWNNDGGSLSAANAVLVNGSTKYAGTSTGVQSCTVLGYSWSSSGTGLTSSVNALIMFGSTLYAGAADGVYKYNTGTSTWSQASSGLPSDGIAALAANANYIFAGTNSHGVYMSTDGGSSWTAVNTGLSSNYPVSSLALNNTTIYTVSSADYNVYSSLLP